MNHIYRVIFNHSLNCYQAAPEISKGAHKSSGSAGSVVGSLPRLSRLSLLVSLAAAGSAYAAPTGGEVSAGQATIAQQGNITDIQQSSQNAAINWQSFGTAPQETVNFHQPNADAVTLNRVLGNERSVLEGAMNANGNVFIQNPNGVLIGKDAQINVGGLVATTARISDEDFMAGNYRFNGAPGGSVKNLGSITVPPGGVVALIAPVVENGGKINAPQGKVLLASAEAFRITLPGDSFAYTLDRGTLQGLVDNGGAILSEGGHVVLTALGTDTVKKSLIRHSGNIEANTVQQKNGKVELLGDLDNSELQLSGSIKAEAPQQGDGGFVETSAARLKITDSAQVSTEAKNGKTGEWLIDPQDLNIGDKNGVKGDVSGALVSARLQKSNVTLKSTDSKTAGNGDINIYEQIGWNKNTLTLNAQNDINIEQNLNGARTAKLKLQYGQASADGGESEVNIKRGVKVDLPEGKNLVIQKGSAGSEEEFSVIHKMPQDDTFPYNKIAIGRDIDISYTANRSNFKGWSFPDNIGSLWGLGHEVKGLTIKVGNDVGYVGLISELYMGTIRDLKITNFNIGQTSNEDVGAAGGAVGNIVAGKIININTAGKIKGLNTQGGIAGRMQDSHIYRSSANIDISSKHMQSGGLVGNMISGVIDSGTSSGKIHSLKDSLALLAGGLVGSSMGNNDKIINSSSSVNIYSIPYHHGNIEVGGLIGVNGGNINIENSYATGNLVAGSTLGSKTAGGLLGYHISYKNGSFININKSYATGNLNGYNYAGGLIGHIWGENKINIENSYFTGNASGNMSVGGLIGHTTDDISRNLTTEINIKDSYATGHISGKDSDVKTGGLVGSVDGSIHIRNSYFNNETTGQTVAVGNKPASTFKDTSVTTAEMKQKDLYDSWDPTVWDIKDGAYPKLRPYDRTAQQNNPGNNNGGNTNPGNNNGGNSTPPNNNNAGNNGSNNQSNNSQQTPNRTYGPAEANYVNPNKRQQPDNKPIEQPAKPKPETKPKTNNVLKEEKQAPIVSNEDKKRIERQTTDIHKIDKNNKLIEGTIFSSCGIRCVDKRRIDNISTNIPKEWNTYLRDDYFQSNGGAARLEDMKKGAIFIENSQYSAQDIINEIFELKRNAIDTEEYAKGLTKGIFDGLELSSSAGNINIKSYLKELIARRKKHNLYKDSGKLYSHLRYEFTKAVPKDSIRHKQLLDAISYKNKILDFKAGIRKGALNNEQVERLENTFGFLGGYMADHFDKESASGARVQDDAIDVLTATYKTGKNAAAAIPEVKESPLYYSIDMGEKFASMFSEQSERLLQAIGKAARGENPYLSNEELQKNQIKDFQSIVGMLNTETIKELTGMDFGLDGYAGVLGIKYLVSDIEKLEKTKSIINDIPNDLLHIDEKVLFLDLVERQKMLKQAELAEVIFKAGKQAYEDNPQIRESINKSMGKAPESLDFSPFLDAIDTSESLTKDGLVPFDTMNNRELARKLIESQRFIEREKNTLDRLLDQQSVEMRDMLISIGENVNITSR